MEQQTITMGQVTYELRRVFQGTHPLSELMAERIAQNIQPPRPLTEALAMGYNQPSGPVYRRRRA